MLNLILKNMKIQTGFAENRNLFGLELIYSLKIILSPLNKQFVILIAEFRLTLQKNTFLFLHPNYVLSIFISDNENVNGEGTYYIYQNIFPSWESTPGG